MDKKLTFEGIEPKITNADLMLMQYSNREGIQELAQVYPDCIVSGCEVTITDIDYVGLTYELSIAKGYVIVDNELIKVNPTVITGTLTNNVPGVNNFSYYVNVIKSTTYNTLGLKTFNNGVEHDTWEINRVATSTRNSYMSTVPPIHTYDIAQFYGNFGESPSSAIAMADTNPVTTLANSAATVKINAYDAAKFGTLATNEILYYENTGLIESRPIVTGIENVTNYHYTKADLNTDGGYYDLDVSGHVPNWAKAVCLRVSITSTNSAGYITLLKYGSTSAYNNSNLNIQNTSISNGADMWVAIDSNQKIKYKTNLSAGGDSVGIVVAMYM